MLNRGDLTFLKPQIYKVFEHIDLIFRNKYDGADKTLIEDEFVTACLNNDSIQNGFYETLYAIDKNVKESIDKNNSKIF